MMSFNPFDHSKCNHEEPKWKIKVSDTLSFDLIKLLHYVWHYTLADRPDLVLTMVGNLGLDIQHAALGLDEKVNVDKPDVKKTVKEDLFLSTEAWIEEMKRLYGEGK